MQKRNLKTSAVRNLILAAGAAILVPGSLAHAQTQNWTNSSGGSATTGSNWSPTGIPTATSSLVYNLANTYTVNWTLSVPTVTSHTFKKGIVTFAGTANISGGDTFTASSFIRVGDVSGDTATATIPTGIFQAPSIIIGNAAGSVGTVNVTDSDADLVASGSGDLIVGGAGTGTLNLTGGGRAAAGDDIILGSAGGDGTINVSGLGITPVRFSNLSTSAADGDIIIGNSNGSVSKITVGTSGIVSSSDDILVGLVGGASGTLDVSGQVNVAGDLGAGFNSTSTTAGAGFITALNNGTINVTGAIRLGDTTAGSGTLSIREGGTVTTHSLITDVDGGFLNHLGGVLNINGGVLNLGTDILTIDSTPGENAVLKLLAGATCSLSSTTAPNRALNVGHANRGEMLISDASLSVTNGDAVVGNTTTGVGILNFQSNATGTFPAGRSVAIGNSGDGQLGITSGADVSVATLNAGVTAGAVGDIVVSGAGTTLDVSGSLNIGGTNTLSGGSGSLTVTDGALVNVTSSTSSNVVIWDNGGSLSVTNGGTLQTNKLLKCPGQFSLDGGTVTTLGLVLGTPVGGGSYFIDGTINGQLQLALGNDTAVLTGPLNINTVASGCIANFMGNIAIGNNTLNLLSSATSHLGNCTIGASGVINSDQPLTVDFGKTLSGDGTINADVTNAGTITATGDGLTFGGMVDGIGQGMSGVRFTFTNGGGFQGGGSLNAKVVGQAGSLLAFTANSLVGDGSILGFTTDGSIDILGGLTISDSNGVGLGLLTTLRSNATLTCASTVNLGATPTLDVLQGQGFVNATVGNAGVIRPGIAGSDETGKLSFLGSLTMFTGAVKGKLEIDLAGTAEASRDVVSCTGPVSLAGSLKVRTIAGFTPNNGDAFPIIVTGSTITGTFDSEDLPARFHIEYDTDEVRVVFCEADFNSDGFVDAIDYDTFINAWLSLNPSADLNGDEFVDAIDYDIFIPGFLGGC